MFEVWRNDLFRVSETAVVLVKTREEAEDWVRTLNAFHRVITPRWRVCPTFYVHEVNQLAEPYLYARR